MNRQWSGGAAAERVLWQVFIASMLIAMVSGAVVALHYQPSFHPLQGKVYVATTPIVDGVGDTLLRSQELVLLDSIPQHHGTLVPVGDTLLKWNEALLSHASIVRAEAGAILVATHQVATSVVISAILLLVLLHILWGYQKRLPVGLLLVLLVLLETTSWLGTVLPGDQRAFDAYSIGRSLIVDNLPIVGDVVAPLLPTDANAARVFALHALWLPAVVGGLIYGLSTLWQRPIEHGIMAATAVGICGIGIWSGLSTPPVLVHTTSAPVWHLAVPYALFHVLPADATMLMCVGWWSLAVMCGASRILLVRVVGALLVAIWLVGSGVISIAWQ
ncbi:MAG: cytochrome b N-terminal domain-containing protein [Candidatus Kapabacteria bacterium]|nr:cytochrome b N-terminal domain-containing protein [Candidatus Kapabacteria bacterium]MCX7936376.1 cytochrome b N-terminal domain-containing protein [Chlorobiota bacterium]